MIYPDPQELIYLDGSFVYIFSDDISLMKYRKVSFYLEKLQQKASQQARELTETGATSLKQIYSLLDSIIYGALKPYYLTIAEALGIERVDELHPKSRHEFFIQKLSTNEAGVTSSYSGLEVLLGAEAVEPGEEEGAEDASRITSGDFVWDIQADVLLSLKHSAPYVLENLGIISTLAVVSQMGQRREYAEKKAEEEAERKAGGGKGRKGKRLRAIAKKEEVSFTDKHSETYEKDRMEIETALKEQGFALPDVD